MCVVRLPRYSCAGATVSLCLSLFCIVAAACCCRKVPTLMHRRAMSRALTRAEAVVAEGAWEPRLVPARVGGKSPVLAASLIHRMTLALTWLPLQSFICTLFALAVTFVGPTPVTTLYHTLAFPSASWHGRRRWRCDCVKSRHCRPCVRRHILAECARSSRRSCPGSRQRRPRSGRAVAGALPVCPAQRKHRGPARHGEPRHAPRRRGASRP